MTKPLRPQPNPKLSAFFYQTRTGNEPVREWLKSLSQDDKKTIGADIRTVQIGYPIGMPLVKKLGQDIYEVRSKITNGIARVIFTIDNQQIILLHGFIKKSQKTPQAELDTAKARLKHYKEQSNDSQPNQPCHRH